MIINKIHKSCIHLLRIYSEYINSEFSTIEVWFTDQGSKLLEIEDKINITLVIN